MPVEVTARIIDAVQLRELNSVQNAFRIANAKFVLQVVSDLAVLCVGCSEDAVNVDVNPVLRVKDDGTVR